MVSSKYGPDQRVGLVEHREQLELALAQEALDRDLEPRARTPPRAPVPGRWHAIRATAAPRRLGIVDADHALTPRAVERLHHPGVGEVGRGVDDEPRLRHLRPCQRGPHRRLVAGGGDRGGRVVGEAESLARGGGDQDTPVVDRHHRVDRGPSVERDDGVGGHLGVVERHHHGPIAHPCCQRLRLLRADDHLDAETGRRPHEIGRPVGGGGQQEEDPRHGPIMTAMDQVLTITDEARATVLDVRNAESRPRLARALGRGERGAGRRLYLPDGVPAHRRARRRRAHPAPRRPLGGHPRRQRRAAAGCHARVQRRHGDAEPEPAAASGCRASPTGRTPISRARCRSG